MDLVFEQRRGGELCSQEQEGRLLFSPLELPGLLRLQPLESVQVRRNDLLGVDLHGAQEVLVDDRGLLLL